MFFGLNRKGKSKAMKNTIRETIDNGDSTIVSGGKESNKEDSQAKIKLKVVVTHGDFIIKENLIQHQLDESFLAELKGDTLYLSSVNDYSSHSSVHNQTIMGNNCTMSGGSMNIVQSGNGGIQTVGNHSGCSIQKSNGIEVRNYNGKKIEIITTKNIPVYVNGKLVENTIDETEDKEDDASIESFPLDGLCVSDIVVNGSGSMIAVIEHTYYNIPILITKGSGGVRIVNVSGDKANFNIQGNGDILGRKVIFETKNKRVFRLW